jgi:hypothetical protein
MVITREQYEKMAKDKWEKTQESLIEYIDRTLLEEMDRKIAEGNKKQEIKIPDTYLEDECEEVLNKTVEIYREAGWEVDRDKKSFIFRAKV